jgi:hypothetical protein
MSGNNSAPIVFPQIPVVSRTGATGDISASWVGVYNRVTCAAPVTMTLTTATTTLPNAEIIIRNPESGTAELIVAPGAGITIDVSSDLGLVVPPGGIGELKRVGLTDTWDFYGYIEA